VHEVNGGPLAGVQVSALPRFGGPSTTTDDQGKFELETVTDEGGLFFQKPGYRWNVWSVPSLSNPSELRSVSAKLQPIFTLSADARVESVITPDDLIYSSEIGNSFWDGTYYCSPCKEIWVRPSAGSGRTLHLRWTGSAALDLWGGEYYGAAHATAVGQAGPSELTLIVPPAKVFDTLLVGLSKRSGAPQRLQETINFQLTIEPAVPQSTR
jgi:hypothetical protein